MFARARDMTAYGPIMIPDQSCRLTKMQQDKFESNWGIHVEIIDSEEWGIWEGQRAPDNAGMLWP